MLAACARPDAGEIEAVTFTSSSTVRNLATLLGGDLEALRDAVVACIGPQNRRGRRSRRACRAPHVVADHPSVDALVAALRRYAAGEDASALAATTEEAAP